MKACELDFWIGTTSDTDEFLILTNFGLIESLLDKQIKIKIQIIIVKVKEKKKTN